jgi:osmotically-inducible protein OsmY
MKQSILVSWMLSQVLACAAAAAVGQSSEGPSASMSRTAVAPDNSKSNKVDETNVSRTADDQKNTAADLKMAQSIRRSVMADKTLSTYAHNAKIISSNGTVTLNGVVSSQAESDNLVQKAEQVAGSGHVVNKLKVEPIK